MMEAQNTPESEPFVCKHCKKYGGWLETHDVCEAKYINNFRQTDCQCENIGHGWNVTISDEPVTDEQLEDYKSVNDTIPKPTLKNLKIKQSDGDKIDIVANHLIDNLDFVTIKETNQIHYWNGKIYDSKNAEAKIKEETERQIQQCTESNSNEVVNKIKRLTYTDIESFDNDPNIVTLENGVYNITTQELTPHTPTNLSKVLIPVNYAKPVHQVVEDNLKGNLFWDYLNTVCTIDKKLDKQMRTDILEMYASCFIKRQIDEISFICYGTGSNGKSVALEYLESIIGEDNVSRIPLQELADDKFASADLVGKMANIYTDIGTHALKHVDKIKNLSSGEKIRAQLKHGQGFTLIPYAKQIFSCNRFPKVYESSNGFFRRWKIINFRRTFAKWESTYDSKLKFKLIEDQKGKDLVFSVVIAISKQLLEKGKFTYSPTPNANRELWNANADPVQNFVEKYTIETDYMSNQSWKETYKFYCEIMYSIGETPLAYRAFNREFSEHYEESKSDKVRTWKNLELKYPKQDSLDKMLDSVNEDGTLREESK